MAETRGERESRENKSSYVAYRLISLLDSMIGSTRIMKVSLSRFRAGIASQIWI